MRDVNRIVPFCEELAEIWSKCPDIRFGQLMMNVFGECAQKGKDAFYYEEATMLREIKAWVEKYYGANE